MAKTPTSRMPHMDEWLRTEFRKLIDNGSQPELEVLRYSDKTLADMALMEMEHTFPHHRFTVRRGSGGWSVFAIL